MLKNGMVLFLGEVDVRIVVGIPSAEEEGGRLKKVGERLYGDVKSVTWRETYGIEGGGSGRGGWKEMLENWRGLARMMVL